MNSQEIEDFLKSIKNTDIEEIKYQNGNSSLYLKKIEVGHIIENNKVVENTVQKIEEKNPELVAIKSTMVGTFTSAQSHDGPLCIKEGDVIIKGQRVGQIEAMKIIKDVLSSVEGKVVKVFVSNGESVEYGQQLFLLEHPKRK
jgi:biotin carboxyl carrier protein